jgi:hypothetical protein
LPDKGTALMTMVLLNIFLVLAVIYLVPILVYGLATLVTELKTPEGVLPARFLFSVFVSKIGTAIAFVLIFYFARESLSGQWAIYAFAWWLMFVLDEIGQVIGPKYSLAKAIAGVISETIYLPVSAYLTNWLVGLKL